MCALFGDDSDDRENVVEATDYTAIESEDAPIAAPEVYRVVDREAGVVVYVAAGNGSGVAAVPLSETDLE